jgi:histidinol-phosphatase (PHP family)
MANLSRSNGRLPQDYHMHTNASCDSLATMAEMCRSALERGVAEIAFTEHFDSKPGDICYGFYRPDTYFEALAAARREFEPQGLTIRAGVELSEHHIYYDIQRPVLEAWPYDLVLGSLHWVGDDSVFDDAYFRAHSSQETAEAYFTELARLARFGGFDVLSHPDVLKRTAFEVYRQFEIGPCEDLVRLVWQACIDNGIGIEINTSALRMAVHEAHPAPAALRWYREMGGELLTVGSDGHRPAHVGYELATALDLARAAGFTRLASYERRKVARWIEI